MHTFWMRQHWLAAQTSVDTLSNVYAEWSKGISQLMGIALGLHVSNERLEEGWIDSVYCDRAFERIQFRLGNCSAGLYSRYGVKVTAPAANAKTWADCVPERA